MISRKDRQKAKRLKSVRDRQHLTQEKMAERLDISYSTYQRMESGRNNITIEHLEKLHKEFGVSSDYIYLVQSTTKNIMNWNSNI